MPCVDSSGELTDVARAILTSLTSPLPLGQVAEKTGLPLYRVRSAARELADAGLVEENDGVYVAADAGRAAIAKAPGKT